jgi:GntR family transcriptional regulator of arabinose operon
MTKGKPLYQSIMEQYQDQIHSAKLKTGDRIPTEHELAEMFNVSRITAIRAVKELEHLGLVSRTKGKGTFVNDRTDWKSSEAEVANKEKFGHSLPILSIVLPFDEYYGYEILRGAEKAARENGYYVTFHCSSYSTTREREIINKLRKDGVQGIIVYPVSSYHNIDVFGEMIIDRYPFVIIDRNIEGLDVPHVVSNNYQGFHSIVSHLVELGHRKIAFVGSSIREAASITERYKGYCKALINSGISLRPEWVVDLSLETPSLPSGPSAGRNASVSEALTKLLSLDHFPTAITAVNDVIAMIVMKEALQMGITIPDQLSITGFDNLSFCEHLEIPLTTVEQSFFSMGEEAVSMLVHDIKTGKSNARQIVLDIKPIIRESTVQPASYDRLAK